MRKVSSYPFVLWCWDDSAVSRLLPFLFLVFLPLQKFIHPIWWIFVFLFSCGMCCYFFLFRESFYCSPTQSLLPGIAFLF
uniref:Uncharacterized protein n=1 Tax=Rhizophora mucronata TaxID=61149 RepID=A0A2P2QAL4_RHIMU